MRKNEKVEEFEERIVMFAVEHIISFNAFDDLSKLFRSASALKTNQLEELKCSRTKATSIVMTKFAPMQQRELANKLKNTKFSIFLDENTNVSSSKCLAMTMRYFDRQLESKFLAMVEMPEAAAQNIFDVSLCDIY